MRIRGYADMRMSHGNKGSFWSNNKKLLVEPAAPKEALGQKQKMLMVKTKSSETGGRTL